MSKTVEVNENSVFISGTEYVPKGSENKSPNYSGDVRIVVLQRGWIYVGRFKKDGNLCSLSNAHCIRSWGTTKGLQELVNGVTSSTKLDKCEGVVEFDWLTVIHTISVKEEAWKQLV